MRGGLSTSRWPSRASSRSASPRRPVPSAGSAPPTPSSATTTVACPLERRDADRRVRGVRVLGDVRDRLGDDVVRGRLDRRRQPLVRQLGDLDGTGARMASASSAGPSPRSVRTAGWMPRASSRSSASPWRAGPARRRAARGRPPGPSRASRSTIRRSSASETSRCCAPSWRLRSSRRRSASPTSTMRAREAASCSWASAFASACATSSAKSHSRCSRSGGSGSSDARRRGERAPELAADRDRRRDRRAVAEALQRLGQPPRASS